MGDLAAKDTASMGFSIAISGRSMDDDIVAKSSANKKKYLCNVSGFSETFVNWTFVNVNEETKFESPNKERQALDQP